ncbi:hypothetical protein [Beduinella massiliensis]|uniref:hypothetical protein n=1 Tax=Beduinella massiliensis TaxID=1852363 RepID=UPI0031F78CA8
MPVKFYRAFERAAAHILWAIAKKGLKDRFIFIFLFSGQEKARIVLKNEWLV